MSGERSGERGAEEHGAGDPGGSDPGGGSRQRGRRSWNDPDGDRADRPWNDPDGDRNGRPWNDPDAGTGEEEGRFPTREIEYELAEDPSVRSIASRYRRIWLGFDGALVVALGIAALIAFLLGGLLAASGLAFLVLLAYRFLPTVRGTGRIVLTTPRSPAAVREALADHRSPLIAVNAVGADRIERTGQNETTVVTGGERIVYDAEREGDGVAFETRSDGDPVVRGTAGVEAHDGGSRVEVEYERPQRFRLRDLLHLPLLEWYQRRLWRHLDYEVEADEGGLRI